MATNDNEDPVTAALCKARYGETVHVTLNQSKTEENEIQASKHDEDGEDTTIYLAPTVTSSGIQFNQVPPDQMLYRDLQTKRWFFPMLNDSHRNRMYCDAIQQCLAAQQGETTIVLDIGTGTGFLAMISASFASCSSVTTVEMSPSLATIAQHTIQDNGLSNKIHVVNNHSTSLQPERLYRVCTSELLDDGLLGEGWIPAMRDAWDRLLAPDCRVVPQRAHVYGQLIQTTTLHIPMTSTGHRVLPVQARKLLRDGVIKSASKPFMMFDFDVTRKESIPAVGGREREISVDLHESKDGAAPQVDAVLVWWDLELYNNITYTTDPHTATIFQDHWHPCLHWLESPVSTDGEQQQVLVHAQHDDYQVRVRLDHQQTQKQKWPKLLVPPARYDMGWSVERAWQLGDPERRESMQRVLRGIVNGKVVILDVSDFCFVGSMAASVGTQPRQIISLESSSGKLPSQTAEWIGHHHKNSTSATFEVRQCYTEQLQTEDMPKVDLLVAEPYFQILEGWHLQEALNLYGIVSVLRQNQVITQSTKIVPRTCQVWGCLIESDSLALAYKRCGDDQEQIQGLDHSFVNKLMWPRFPTLSLALWQYDYRELCRPFELGCLCYTDPSSSILSKTASVTVSTPGRIDAMKIWVDYSLDAASILSTNNKRHNQLIHMLDHPLIVKSPMEVQCCTKLGDSVEGNDDHFFEIKMSRPATNQCAP